MNTSIRIFVLLLFVVLYGLSTPAYSASPMVDQITDNATDDINLQVSRGCAAWQGLDPCDGWEIFLYEEGSILQLTDNDTDDINPNISGGHIVWQGWDGHDWEIFVYNGYSVTQLTDNDANDVDPKITDSLVFWQGWDGQDWEIFNAPIPQPPMPLRMKIVPQAINLKSNGNWIIALLWFPITTDMNQVDPESIILEDQVALDLDATKILHGAHLIMVYFDRAEVNEVLTPGDNVELTVKGLFTDGSEFISTDTVKVIDPGK